jgi:cell wall-associated NlpC family hydrolase
MRPSLFRVVFLPLVLTAVAALSGCASAPLRRSDVVVAPQSEELSLGAAVAELAMGMVGAPYHYGGDDPSEGFDCSGLVYYAFAQSGYGVPRMSRDQFRVARKIALHDAGAGDVMFFQDQEKLSHVGIYIGDGLFVHAPAKGQRVTVGSIHAPYYQEHLVAVGRLLPP